MIIVSFSMQTNNTDFCIYLLWVWYPSQAGIDGRRLQLALESEVAAILVKHLPIDKMVDSGEGLVFQCFAQGSKYLLVDAGGMK